MLPTGPGRSYIYNYDGASRRLQSIAGSSYSFAYDARGNVLSNGSANYVFDAANKLVTAVRRVKPNIS